MEYGIDIPLKTRLKLPYDPVNPLLGIYPKETKIEKGTRIPSFIAALLTIARTWKQPRYPLTVHFSSVQLFSCVRLFVTPWITARQASVSVTNSRRLLKLMSIESVMPSSHLILCRLLLFLPPIPPSIRVFSNESTLRMRWPKYWSFSFSVSPSSEHPGLICFRMDWLDLLEVQGTVKSPLKHHSSKVSIFGAQLSW